MMSNNSLLGTLQDGQGMLRLSFEWESFKFLVGKNQRFKSKKGKKI